MKTLETAILFPILLVAIVLLIQLMIGACNTTMHVSDRILENTKQWSESAPGKSWSGVANELE
ncbi:MAG: hypothetical protein WCL54_08125 [Clostridia bacterium]